MMEKSTALGTMFPPSQEAFRPTFPLAPKPLGANRADESDSDTPGNQPPMYGGAVHSSADSGYHPDWIRA